MKIEKIIKAQQPGTYKNLNRSRKHNRKKSRRGKNKDLSFFDVMNLMKHDSYRRVKGRLRRI